MKTITFKVFALYPYHSKANEMLKIFDLGIEGGYVPKSETWAIRFKEGVQPDRNKTKDILMATLKEFGCLEIFIEDEWNWWEK